MGPGSDFYQHTADEKALIAALHDHVPDEYVIPAYAAMWWLKGVTLYLNDQRLPSVRFIQKKMAETGGAVPVPVSGSAESVTQQ